MDCLNKGLLHVEQLFNSNCFKLAWQVHNKFGMDVMRYNSLVSCIPKSVKNAESSINASVPILEQEQLLTSSKM